MEADTFRPHQTSALPTAQMPEPNPAPATRHPSPDDLTRVITPFLGRRLHAIWRSPGKGHDAGDVWLEFCPRDDAPSLLRLTANIAFVTSWHGPSPWSLSAAPEAALPGPLEAWQPLPPGSPAGSSLRDWSLTELWLSPVACDVMAPAATWLQDVCGGVALHFSNTTGPNCHGRLLGTIYEHHDLDTPHTCFCSETLPPLVGSGLWRRSSYLRDDTRRDDAAVCHFDGSGFGGPAVAACLTRLQEALLAFLDGFEREPRFGAFRRAATRQWYARHVGLLYKAQHLLAYADLAIGHDRDGAEALRRDIATFGLGTLFSEAWHERDGASPDEPATGPGAGALRDIRQRYAPVREAYRQWFLLHRQACIARQRVGVPCQDEAIPPWMLGLDAALTRGSVRFDDVLECPTARLLRDDYRAAWAPFDELDWIMRHGGIGTAAPQDVLIEGDEERRGTLRITWWPVLHRRDQVIVLRVAAEALEGWWAGRAEQPSPWDRLQAARAGRPVTTEPWPTFADIVARAAQPPGVDIRDLPPYSQDDICRVAALRMQGESFQRWPAVHASDAGLVWTFDANHHRVPLLLGRDSHPLMSIDAGFRPAERVIFPARWPAHQLSRDPFKPFYLTWHQSHWRGERIEGRDYRPLGWLLPVQRWVALTDDAAGPHAWRWGLIDIDGRFVVPCRHPAMGFPQPRSPGRPTQPERALPPGRREPWCWVWVGEAEHAEGLLDTQRRAVAGDVIEAWSGERMNPVHQQAYRLDGQFMVVGPRSKPAEADGKPPPAYGLCNLATGRHGPIRWRQIDTFGLSITHAGPAQCAASGLWAYLDDAGEALVPATFARAGQVDSGLAIVELSVGQADEMGITLTLPDGTRQGPVGVFGPDGAASLGQWFVEPRWRDLEGEYDGHFVVQARDGRWGMITPEGEPVTPFVQRRERDDFNGGILQQVIGQFKRLQRRRFSAWMRCAVESGSLAVMAGKLRSSFGAYDYGALTARGFPVHLRRSLPPAPAPYDAVSLTAGSEFMWRPGQRNYMAGVDLRTHAMIGPPGQHDGGYHGLAVPWDALVLARPARGLADDDERRQLEHLGAPAHRQALDALVQALDALIDALDSDTDAAPGGLLDGCLRLDRSLTELIELLDWRLSAGGVHLVVSWVSRALRELDFANATACDPGGFADSPAKAARPPALRQRVEQVHSAYLAWEPLFTAASVDEDEPGTQA